MSQEKYIGMVELFAPPNDLNAAKPLSAESTGHCE